MPSSISSEMPLSSSSDTEESINFRSLSSGSCIAIVAPESNESLSSDNPANMSPESSGVIRTTSLSSSDVESSTTPEPVGSSPRSRSEPSTDKRTSLSESNNGNSLPALTPESPTSSRTSLSESRPSNTPESSEPPAGGLRRTSLSSANPEISRELSLESPLLVVEFAKRTSLSESKPASIRELSLESALSPAAKPAAATAPAANVPASTPGVALLSSAGADASRMSLSESRPVSRRELSSDGFSSGAVIN